MSITILTLTLAPLAATPEFSVPEAVMTRAAAANTLRVALEETEQTAGERLGALAAAARKAGDQLGEARFARLLAALTEETRWRALFDVEAAGTELETELRRAVIDLTFEPRQEADLPEGFPPPTPVREIELKRYPAYRMAQTSMSGARENGAFWTLFQHIQRNDIPMTAPVEIDYDESESGLRRSSMAFMYQSPSVGTIGADGGAEVIDVEEQWVVSIGCRGRESNEAILSARAAALKWIEGRADLRVAGPMRTMNYNSPMVPTARRYFEVQIPVQRMKPKQVKI